MKKLSPIFLEFPLFIGRTALIYEKCFRLSVLFRNFGFVEITFRSELKRKACFSFHFSHLFRNFAASTTKTGNNKE